MAPASGPTRRERWRAERRHLRFTREGWYYFFFTLGVGIAALNTGNNLLFLVLGLQLSAIVISGVLSESCLRSLQVERLLPNDPAAGDRFAVTYVVHNRKRRWPSFALELAEKDGLLAGRRASALHVGPGESVAAVLETSLERRGRLALGAVMVSTRFPFGFFEKWRELEVPGELYVLPARVRAVDRRAEGGFREGERPEGRAGVGAEFHGLRELRPGDERRLIHWRKSASAGTLLVVEREREQRRRVVLVVDNRGGEGSWLEPLVEQAAASARLLAGRGMDVGLATSGDFLAPDSGPGQLRRLLRRLAVLEARSGGPAPDARREASLVVATAGGRAA